MGHDKIISINSLLILAVEINVACLATRMGEKPNEGAIASM